MKKNLQIPAADFPANAHWIGDCQRPTAGEQPCPFLRKSFHLEGEVQRAELTWTALGVAEPHLNGKKIGSDFLSPGWSDFRYRAQVMTCDVTQLLQAGENTLGTILGDGWYSGTLLWKNERNHYGTHPQFRAHLRVEMRDGRRLSIVTDASWRMRYGAILFSDIYHGETYDARRDLGDWSTPGAPQRGWRPAGLFPAYKEILQPKINEPVRITQTIRPRKIAEPKPGTYVFDFGQNLAGFCRLKVRGSRGQKITLKFAEMLEADGSVYRANLRLARCTDTYICRGEGIEEWTPRFTFHGFRYVEVTGLGQKPEASLLTAQVLHSDMTPTGRFQCSNPLLSRLNSNISWGQRGNFLDVPTDCPQRDERLGWTGDAQVFIGTAAFHYDIRRFFHKWMQDVRDGQRDDGAYPDIAPDLLGRYSPNHFGNAAWADAGVICPWQIYQLYGDKKILADNYAAMGRWIEYQRTTSRALLRPRTVYGDWLAIDAVNPTHAPVPSDLIGTAYFAHTTELMARIARVLGHGADARNFTALHRKIVAAFQNAYVTPGGRVVGHCQTAYLLALAFDLIPSRSRAHAFAALVDLVESRDCHLTTGFVGTPLLLPVLSRFGRTDLAYKILLQEDYPSWLYSVRNGATTVWERWNSYTKEKGFGPVDMNSFNHYAYGAVGEWMVGVIGGIRPLSPGFKSFLIAPEPGGNLTSASTEFLSAAGQIACNWQISGNRLTITAEVPDGARARLKVPAPYLPVQPVPAFLPPGHHKIEAVSPASAK